MLLTFLPSSGNTSAVDKQHEKNIRRSTGPPLWAMILITVKLFGHNFFGLLIEFILVDTNESSSLEENFTTFKT